MSELSFKEQEVIAEILGMTELRPTQTTDDKRLQYNQYYKTFDYWCSKFPKGFENVPEMKLIIDNIVENKKDTSPLEELQKLNITDDGETTFN
jgi:hypothetical protein